MTWPQVFILCAAIIFSATLGATDKAAVDVAFAVSAMLILLAIAGVVS